MPPVSPPAPGVPFWLEPPLPALFPATVVREIVIDRTSNARPPILPPFPPKPVPVMDGTPVPDTPDAPLPAWFPVIAESLIVGVTGAPETTHRPPLLPPSPL